MTVTHFQPCPSGSAAARRHTALDDLSDAAQWVLATLRQWRRRIRERDQLGRMDERMLKDIGLTRAEALHLASRPFWKE